MTVKPGRLLISETNSSGCLCRHCSRAAPPTHMKPVHPDSSGSPMSSTLSISPPTTPRGPHRSARLALRATAEQERVLRRAAEVAHKPLTDFILESACQAAEETLLEQRLFLVSGDQYQSLLALLDAPRKRILACMTSFPAGITGKHRDLGCPPAIRPGRWILRALRLRALPLAGATTATRPS